MGVPSRVNTASRKDGVDNRIVLTAFGGSAVSSNSIVRRWLEVLRRWESLGG